MTPDTTRTDGDRPANHGDLHATVVRYDDAPDRCTVSPVDAPDDRALTAWLSVDAGLLCPLDAMR